jgi:hypothetical protein
MDEACGHVEPAFHTPGESLDGRTRTIGESSPVETPGDGFVERWAAQAMIAAEGCEILAAGKKRVESQLLRNPSQAGAGGGRTDWVTEDTNVAGVGMNTPHDAADESGFACAVWTEKAKAGRGRDFQGDAGDGSYRAEKLSDVAA